MRQTIGRTVAISVLPLLLCVSCARKPAALAQIQQQRSGDYVVTLLNETGTLKQQANKLTLEFRNASAGELVNVDNLQIQATMPMAGMGPMFGNVSPSRQTGQGRYDFAADFSMAGQWNFVITFEPNGAVQFRVSAQ